MGCFEWTERGRRSKAAANNRQAALRLWLAHLLFCYLYFFFQRNAAHMDVIENNICWQNDNLMRGCTCAHSYLGQNRFERVQHITHTDIFSQKKNHTRPRSTQPDHCHPPTNQKKHFCIHFL